MTAAVFFHHTSIVHIDMHIRDERVLDFIQSQIKQHGGEAQLSHEQIAERFCCHRNTAAAIVWRLELAGHIQIEKSAKRGGYVYRDPKAK